MTDSFASGNSAGDALRGNDGQGDVGARCRLPVSIGNDCTRARLRGYASAVKRYPSGKFKDRDLATSHVSILGPAGTTERDGAHGFAKDVYLGS